MMRQRSRSLLGVVGAAGMMVLASCDSGDDCNSDGLCATADATVPGNDGSPVDASGSYADKAPQEATLDDIGSEGAPIGIADAGRDGPAVADAADAAAIAVEPWPGANQVTTVDGTNVFGTNLSGLTYQPAAAEPAVIWAVRNGPSTLFRLVFDGTTWGSTTTDDWQSGKTLLYTDGTGSPDSEGVTKAEWESSAVYVSTERDNAVGTISRLSVLRFDTAVPGVSLTATHEWNLTADLPSAGANLGLEAITWVPDAFLVSRQFIDESNGQPYDPGRYPDHGTGVFVVGLEANGVLYAYVLDHQSGAFQKIATFGSGQNTVMDVQFDRDVGYLWTVCDNTCGNKTGILQLDDPGKSPTGNGDPSSPTRGRFHLVRVFDRPSTLPNVNNEGIAIAPESECMDRMKSFFWTDDDQTGGHALRHDLIPCGPFLGDGGF